MKKILTGFLFFLLIFSISGCGADTEVEDTIQEGEVHVEIVPDEEAAMESAQDEETRTELVTQLLQEHNMDTSVVKSTVETDGCSFTLPEDFLAATDMPGMYVTKYYPVDLATIYYAELDKDIALQLMTEESYVEHIQESLFEAYGTDVEVTLESFESIKIDGYPAFRILCSYTIEDVRLTQLEYVINADKSYIITYSQTDEYDRMSEYEASAATIQVES